MQVFLKVEFVLFLCGEASECMLASVYLKLDHCEGGSQGLYGQSDFPFSLRESQRSVRGLVRAGIVIP